MEWIGVLVLVGIGFILGWCARSIRSALSGGKDSNGQDDREWQGRERKRLGRNAAFDVAGAYRRWRAVRFGPGQKASNLLDKTEKLSLLSFVDRTAEIETVRRAVSGANSGVACKAVLAPMVGEFGPWPYSLLAVGVCNGKS